MSQYYNKLLDKVSDIAGSYGHSNNTSENDSGFNIFKVLRLSRYEVKTHTPFLAELLNPSGSHQQGELFLQEFIELLIKRLNNNDSRKKFLEGFSYVGAKVRKESTMAETHKNEHIWGNMDILIENRKGDKPDQSIIIENKVDAYDQEKQLERYYNYGKAKYQENNFCLIYLTPDGRKPSKYSAGDLTESNYLTVSYSEDIIQWLEKCNEKHDDENLSVIINQYINSIRSLTKKIMSEKMKDKVAKQLIENKDSFEAAYCINESLTLAKDKLIHNFLNKIAEEMELKITKNLITGESQSSKAWFHKDGWKSQFCLCFDEKNFSHLWIGIAKDAQKTNYTTSKEIESRDEICRKMTNTPQFKTCMAKNTIYAWTGYIEDLFPKDWDRLDIWSDIMSGDENEFKEKIRNIFTELSTVLDQVYTEKADN